MSIILAIEPDRRRAAQLTGMARTHLKAELLVAPNASEAIDALAGRVPDVLLTAPLLPSQEEAAIGDYLRQLGAGAAHVQTLTIPLLASGSGDHDRPVLSAFRRGRVQRSEAEGCDPAVFAEQITEYLREARDRRVAPVVAEVPPPAPPSVDAPEVETLPALRTLTKKETISELLARLFPAGAPEDDNPSPDATEMFAAEFEAALPVEPSSPVSRMAKPGSSTIYELQPITAVDPVVGREEEPSSVVLPATNVRPMVTLPVSGAPQTAANVAVAVSMNVGANVATAPSPKRGRSKQSVQDEWGFFDPTQCGFPALVAKLDEIAARDSDN